MTPPTLALLLVTGALLGIGIVLVVGADVPATPSLAASLDRLDGTAGAAADWDTVTLPTDAPRTQRWGAWLHAHTPVPLTRTQLHTLQLRSTTVAEFYADKAVLAVVSAALPLVVGGLATLLLDSSPVLPAGLTLVGVVVGWVRPRPAGFVPDLQLRRAASAVRSDAGEALFTFFDLVTLERLANLSGTQALHSAASLSDATLFPQIRAALSGALRARVKELRDAHLARAKIAANAVSERMTVFIVIS